ncbi:tail fiber protein [Methanococcoides sp. SA1]|nr:tail fiber protein [Methanococcoides sp. SA1]
MVKIDLQKRDFVWVLILFSVSVVFAYGSSNPDIMGHSAGELNIEDTNVITNCPDNQFLDGDGSCLTAAEVVAAGGSGAGVPVGAIMAFYSASCPSGWVLANGASGTPDLRGSFVRGMYGNQNDRDVSRSLGSYQADALQTHTHQSINKASNTAYTNIKSDRPDLSVRDSQSSGVSGARTSSETRPRNVALTYCMKN